MLIINIIQIKFFMFLFGIIFGVHELGKNGVNSDK